MSKCRHHRSACWNSPFFFIGKINADIKELFLWYSKGLTGSRMTSEPSVIRAACQLRNFIWVCLKFAVGNFQHIWEGEAFTLTFLVLKDSLIWLYNARPINSVSRVQQICPISGFSEALVSFAFVISSSDEVHTDLYLLLSMKKIPLPFVLFDHVPASQEVSQWQLETP